jgi:hypothetical protein
MAGKKLFDKNLIIIFGFILVLVLGVVVFKFFTRDSCPEVKFSIINTNIKAGDLVYFKDNTEGAKTYKWDFGDSITAEIANPSHAFLEPGEYTVWLYVNGCADGHYEKIAVASREIPSIDTILPIGGIAGPATAVVGEVVSFRDSSIDATAWEWQFGETGITDATEKEVKYIFKQPGEHIVSLVINGKSRTANHTINIKPKAVAGGAKRSCPDERKFIEMLNKIIAHEEKGAGIFSQYMCGYTNQFVRVNGVEKVFDSYCTGLYLSGSNKKIKSVTIGCDKQNCVNSIDIIEEKKTE